MIQLIFVFTIHNTSIDSSLLNCMTDFYAQASLIKTITHETGMVLTSPSLYQLTLGLATDAPTFAPTLVPTLAPTLPPVSQYQLGSYCLEYLFITGDGTKVCSRYPECGNFTVNGYEFPLGGTGFPFLQKDLPYAPLPVPPQVPSMCLYVTDENGVFCDDDDGFIAWQDYPTSSVGYYVGCALCGASMLYCVLALVFLFYYRSRPIIQMSQFSFSVIFVVGIFFVNLALLLLITSFVYPTSVACAAAYGLLAVAATLMTSSLLVKELRAVHLFIQSSNLRRVNIPDKYLYLFIIIACSIVLILLIFYWIFELPSPQCGRKFCSMGVLIIVCFSIVGLIVVSLLVLIYFAWRVSSVAAESKAILIAMINLVIMTIAMFIIYSTTNLDINQNAILYSAYFTEVAGVALSLIVFRRALYLNLSHQQVVERFIQGSRSIREKDGATKTTKKSHFDTTSDIVTRAAEHTVSASTLTPDDVSIQAQTDAEEQM